MCRNRTIAAACPPPTAVTGKKAWSAAPRPARLAAPLTFAVQRRTHLASDAMAKPCVFCSILAGESPAHVVLDDDVVLAFLDVRPLFAGPVLVVPRPPIETLPELPAEQRSDERRGGKECGSRCRS